MDKSPNKNNRLYFISKKKKKKKGVLAEENMFGVRFNIQDIELNIDDIHQGGG